jgi:hypothetical protein
MDEKPARAMSPERMRTGRKNALRAAVARDMVRCVRKNAQELFGRYEQALASGVFLLQ